MSSEKSTRGTVWDRPWILWVSSAALLAVVAALVVVGVRGMGATEPAPAADALPTGLNEATAELIGAAPVATDPVTAPAFALTDQNGRTVDSASLRGKVVVLSFNDDKCTDLCAMLADDIRVADTDLPAAARAKVEFVSINANPYYPKPADVKAWSAKNGLDTLPNWEYLTGTSQQLAAAARAYDVPIELDADTRTVSHGSQIFVIGPAGHIVGQAAFGAESADTGPFAHGLAVLAVDALPHGDPGDVAGKNLAAALPGGTGIGDTPAAVRGPSLSGPGTVSSASTRGSFTVVDFWSSTCAACTQQLSADRTEAKTLGGQVAFLGVDVGDDTNAGRSMAAREHIAFPVLNDAAGTQAARYRVSELPYTVILSPDGTVLVRHPGLFTADELDYVVRELDAKLPPGDG